MRCFKCENQIYESCDVALAICDDCLSPELSCSVAGSDNNEASSRQAAQSSPVQSASPPCPTCDPVRDLVGEMNYQRPRIEQLYEEYQDGTYQHRLAEGLLDAIDEINRAKAKPESNVSDTG